MVMVEEVFTFGLVMKILRRHHRRRKPLKIAKMSVCIWVKSLGLSWRWHRYQNTRQHFKRPGNISGPKIAILMLPATWLTYTLTPHTYTSAPFCGLVSVCDTPTHREYFGTGAQQRKLAYALHTDTHPHAGTECRHTLTHTHTYLRILTH